MPTRAKIYEFYGRNQTLIGFKVLSTTWNFLASYLNQESVSWQLINSRGKATATALQNNIVISITSNDLLLFHRLVSLNSHLRNITTQIYYLSMYRIIYYKDLTLNDLLLSSMHSVDSAIIVEGEGAERLKEPGRRGDFNKTLFYT